MRNEEMIKMDYISVDANYNQAVDTRRALVAAWHALPAGLERTTIACMLVQRGCEVLEPATETLTSLCDVIMFG